MNGILPMINSREWVRGEKKEKENDVNDLSGEGLSYAIWYTCN